MSQAALLAGLLTLTTLTGCARGTIDIRYPAAAANTALLATVVSQVVVATVTDRRPDTSRIGARPGNGKPIVTSRPVPDIVREALVAELRRNGHNVLAGPGDVAAAARAGAAGEGASAEAVQGPLPGAVRPRDLLGRPRRGSRRAEVGVEAVGHPRRSRAAGDADTRRPSGAIRGRRRRLRGQALGTLYTLEGLGLHRVAVPGVLQLRAIEPCAKRFCMALGDGERGAKRFCMALGDGERGSQPLEDLRVQSRRLIPLQVAKEDSGIC